jgi:HSP20 family protein
MKPIQIIYSPLFGFLSSDIPAYHISNIINYPYSATPHIWRPNTDVFETEESYIVRVEIAGMDESDFSLTIDPNHLLINGVRTDYEARKAFHQMEIHFGEFNVMVELPPAIDIERVEANYQDGFLKVTIPKSTPRKIDVK